AACLVETDIDRELVATLFAGADESGLADLAAEINLEPVGRIVSRDIGVDLIARPLGKGCAEFGLRGRDPRATIDLGETAGQHRFGLVIQRPQQLRFPAVPDTR